MRVPSALRLLDDIIGQIRDYVLAFAAFREFYDQRAA